ncbi:MAG: hypothetical protein ABIG95_04775 [Candidatus Woesearchaeota archaeon]
MEVSNEMIYKKLDEILGALRELKSEEDQLVHEKEKIELEEKKAVELLGQGVSKQFTNILEWKRYIWENCEYKKPMVEEEKIDFICKKTGKSCRFIDCFKNKA